MPGYFFVSQMASARSNAPDDKVNVHPNTVGCTTDIGYDQPHKTESTITANAIFLCLKKTIVSPAHATRNQIACLESFFKKDPMLPKKINVIAVPTQHKAMTFGVHIIPVDKGICDPPEIAAARVAVTRIRLLSNKTATARRDTPTATNMTIVLARMALPT
jgi:hypothetical protein